MEMDGLPKERGLSEAQAAERLIKEGRNELPTTKRRSLPRMLFEFAKEPMLLLLLSCGAIYLALGSLEDALVLLGFVFFVIGITVYQEHKTERALEALRDLSSPRALVIRDGEQRRIAGRDVVRDDLIKLAEGDRVPADATLLWSSNLSVDESLLTGESAPVRKRAGDGSEQQAPPGGDDRPFVYSGTLVVQGQGIARVTATGMKTELGKIGRALERIEEEETILQKETRKLVRNVAIACLLFCLIVVFLYGFTRGDWLKGILSGLTLAMSILPEEIPVVLTIFLALGAWRMSQKKVLTRRSQAIHMLGAATVLCSDKTGTITQNKMTIRRLCAQGMLFEVDDARPMPLPEALHGLVEYSLLASRRDPFDPMEKAVKALGEMALDGTDHLHKDWTLVHEYPLSKELLALSHVWRSQNSKKHIIAAKGAPEAMMELCHLDAKARAALEKKVVAMADDGLRVIGVAKASFDHASLPKDQHEFAFEFVGLVGFEDPLRPEVKDAIEECRGAGIKVVMITGDYAGTARHIAAQAGLETASVITGPELEQMDDTDLRRRIVDVTIFARVVPEQKLRIVNALKAAEQVVIMTGDGVNDAPALKAAHVGIAMGNRGTDVARESSGLVLLDDAFSSIVSAVRHGRRIFDNLQKAFAYTFAVHVPIAGLTLIPLLFGWPLMLLPVHIAFLELIINPACSIVFEGEPAEKDLMRRPPRKAKQPLFSRQMIMMSLLQGAIVLVVCLAMMKLALDRGFAESEVRSLVFTTLVVGNIALILTNRSWTRSAIAMVRTPNKALWIVTGSAIAILALVLTVPFLQGIFKFSALQPYEVALAVGNGLLSVAWFEVVKLLYGKKMHA